MRWMRTKQGMRTKPVARSEGLLVEQVGDETVVYDTQSKGAHCMSPLAASVFAHCDGNHSLDQLADVAAERLGEPVDSGRVLDALVQLDDRALLVSGAPDGVTRRDLLQKGALAGAAAMAAPLISSIVVPTPAAAATPTCGDILCCPCFQGQRPDPTLPSQGQQCCVHPTVIQCNCTAAEVGGCKQCKPQGPAATTGLCAQTFGPGTIFPPSSAPCPCPKSKIPDFAAVP